jgi:hypothetical protein
VGDRLGDEEGVTEGAGMGIDVGNWVPGVGANDSVGPCVGTGVGL